MWQPLTFKFFKAESRGTGHVQTNTSPSYLRHFLTHVEKTEILYGTQPCRESYLAVPGWGASSPPFPPHHFTQVDLLPYIPQQTHTLPPYNLPTYTTHISFITARATNTNITWHPKHLQPPNEVTCVLIKFSYPGARRCDFLRSEIINHKPPTK